MQRIYKEILDKNTEFHVYLKSMEKEISKEKEAIQLYNDACLSLLNLKALDLSELKILKYSIGNFASLRVKEELEKEILKKSLHK